MTGRLFFVCAFLTVASAVPPGPRHIKGIQIKNKGSERLWIEMTNEDSFSLPPGQTASVILEDTWSGRIFARSEECQYKKCDTPYTMAELTFGREEAKEDRYRVSVEEGYNQPMKIQPTGHRNFCKTSSCSINLNQDCLSLHQVKDESENIIACRPISNMSQKLCPQSALLNNDKEMLSCTTSNTYFISIG